MSISRQAYIPPNRCFFANLPLLFIPVDLLTPRCALDLPVCFVLLTVVSSAVVFFMVADWAKDERDFFFTELGCEGTLDAVE